MAENKTTTTLVNQAGAHTLVLVHDAHAYAKLSEFVANMFAREICVLGDLGFAFYSSADACVAIQALRQNGIDFTVFMRVDI
ncbi:hypothetical protein DPMN_045213 [Dreissena polymorpha]|uniref:Uncharacterized protein n=1 Tax=Dreissena polymorpha TaxID=45954 RepID=A0A9D4D5T8_DREPO|nr:hypothetical protein DPMN_045213 [Dreissena polymorpha]